GLRVDPPVVVPLTHAVVFARELPDPEQQLVERLGLIDARLGVEVPRGDAVVGPVVVCCVWGRRRRGPRGGGGVWDVRGVRAGRRSLRPPAGAPPRVVGACPPLPRACAPEPGLCTLAPRPLLPGFAPASATNGDEVGGSSDTRWVSAESALPPQAHNTPVAH